MESNGWDSNGLSPQQKVRSLEVELDRCDEAGDAVYCPGETLTGHVRLLLTARLAVKNVDLLVQGIGQVSWLQRQAQGEQQVEEDEVYLNDIADLVGREDDELVALSPGEHLLPFACDLPVSLPASFKGTNGSVSYMVKVVLRAERSEHLHQEPCIATRVFNVDVGLALSNYTDLLNRMRLENKTPVKPASFGLGSNSVKVLMLLPRRVFDTDDTILACVELVNASRRRVSGMGLALVMEVMYKAKGRSCSERMVVVNQEAADFVRPGERKKWFDVALKVPRMLPPSNQPHSGIISVRYWLVFKADIEKSRSRVLMQTPVIVGARIPAELKAADVQDLPTPQAESDLQQQQQQQQRILYRGSVQPRTTASLSQSLAPQAHEPLEVEVDYGRPASEYGLPRTPRQSWTSPARTFGATEHTDTQVAVMRFTDDLDGPRSPYDRPRVSRNPLYTDDLDDGTAYQDERRDIRRDSNRILQSAFGNGTVEVAANGQQDHLY